MEPCSSPEHDWCDPINSGGYLYRTQYLVLSRTLLEAMPKEWQHRFVSLIDEVSEEFDFFHNDFPVPHYKVNCQNEEGRMLRDPWGTYRNPNTDLIDKIRKKK